MKGHIYQLVTDEGFLTRKNLVWETLQSIDGSGEFYDSNFNKYIEESTDNDTKSHQISKENVQMEETE